MFFIFLIINLFFSLNCLIYLFINVSFFLFSGLFCKWINSLLKFVFWDWLVYSCCVFVWMVLMFLILMVFIWFSIFFVVLDKYLKRVRNLGFIILEYGFVFIDLLLIDISIWFLFFIMKLFICFFKILNVKLNLFLLCLVFKWILKNFCRIFCNIFGWILIFGIVFL